MNKKGFVTIFSLMVIITLVAGLTMLIRIAKHYQLESYLSGRIKLVGNKILSRYDKELFTRYGVLAVKKESLKDENNLFNSNLKTKDYSLDNYNLKYKKSIINSKLLKNNIFNNEKNRFVYNTSKKIITSISENMSKMKETNDFNKFNNISEIYEKILND